MLARFSIINPQKIEAKMEIMMTIEEWEQLRDQLENRWPSSRLSLAVSNLLSQAKKVFYVEHEAL